jgi:hypothetical protein
MSSVPLSHNPSVSFYADRCKLQRQYEPGAIHSPVTELQPG